MGGIHFCGCGCQSEDPFVCFGVKPTQKDCTQDFPQDQNYTEEGSRQNREFNKTGQSAEESRS